MDPITTVIVVAVLTVALLVARYVFGLRVTAEDVREFREALEEGVLLAEQSLKALERDMVRQAEDLTKGAPEEQRKLAIRQAKDKVNAQKKRTAIDHAKSIAGKQAKKIVRQHGESIVESMLEATVPRVKQFGGLLGKMAGKLL